MCSLEACEEVPQGCADVAVAQSPFQSLKVCHLNHLPSREGPARGRGQPEWVRGRGLQGGGGEHSLKEDGESCKELEVNGAPSGEPQSLCRGRGGAGGRGEGGRWTHIQHVANLVCSDTAVQHLHKTTHSRLQGAWQSVGAAMATCPPLC